MFSANELTVCSVSFGNAKHLRLNEALASHLNAGGDKLKWIIAENTPVGSTDRLELTNGAFTVIPGIEGNHTPTYHHTLALSETLKHVTTRFVLILDPDFYIIKKSWIELMLSYMVEQDLALLGVPWHPRYMDKYRYFPAVHCTIFDTEKFDLDRIDFRPDYPNGPDDTLWPNGYEEDKNYFCINPISRLLSRLPLISSRRRFYTDTGGRLYKSNVQNKSLKYECLLPVFSSEKYPNTLSSKGKILEKLLPDELCYFPKDKDSYIEKGLAEEKIKMQFPNVWEEFVWKNRAFGFHVRRHAQKEQRNATDEVEFLEKAINRVIKLGGI